MMKTALLPLALLSLASAAGAAGAAAQDDALHVEVLGPAVLSSVNYERLFNANVSARAGIGWLPGFDIGDRLHAPVMLNVLVGRGQHRLEVGAGPVFAYALNRGIEEEESVRAGFRDPYAAGTLAYRLEPGESSVLHGGIYRIGFTPLYYEGEMHPFFGASAGFYLSALRRPAAGAAHASR